MKRAVGEVRDPQKENRWVSSLPGVTAVTVNPVLGLFLLLHLVETSLSVIHPNKPPRSPPDGPPGWACSVLHGKEGLTRAKSMYVLCRSVGPGSNSQPGHFLAV